MGVYLPNINMPKGDKFLTIQIFSDGSIWQQYSGMVPNAKAVYVAPHGRLMDADSFVMENYKPYGAIDAIALEAIKAAPTVIPAEKEEKT